jgi:hypothetical protein
MQKDQSEGEPLLGQGTAVVDDYEMPVANEGPYKRAIGRFVRAETDAGLLFEEFMTVMIWALSLLYVFITLPDLKKYRPEVDIFGTVLSIVFLCEYFLRLWAAPERSQFLFSVLSIVDLFTIVPYLIAVSCFEHLHGLQFLRLLRLFSRFEEGKGSGHAGVALAAVWTHSRRLLYSSTYLLIAIWFMIAALNHIAERDNPEVAGRFDTFLGSMWWSLVNMMGEYPVNSQLTNWGKLVGTITMIIAIGGVQGIPAGVLTDGYQAHMEKLREEKMEEEGTEEDEELLMDAMERELSNGNIQKDSTRWLDRLYLFINGHTAAGDVLEVVVLVLVVANVFGSMLNTVQSVRDVAWWGQFYDILETSSMSAFTVEYVLRFIAVGAHQQYQGWRRIVWATTTFFALVDLVTILPWFVDLLVPGDAVIPTSFIRVLRLLRIMRVFKTGKLVDGLHVITSVTIGTIPILSSIMYGIAILWILASVGMYYTERNNPIPKVADQFRSIPDAMWLTLLNFSGEYPIADYTDSGKVVSMCVAFVAIAAFGIPVAVLSDGISEGFAKLEARDAATREEAEAEEEVVLAASSSAEEKEMPFLRQLYYFMKGQDLNEGDVTLEDPWYETWGVRFEVFVLCLILLNTVCFIFQSIPGFGGDTFFSILEGFSIVVYTTEFILRLLATYGDPALIDARFPPIHYIVSVFGVVDILAITPWYLAQFVPGVTHQLTVLRTLRLVRLLKFERYLPGFGLLARVVQLRYSSLVASTYVLGLCTIFFANLLHYTEKDNDVVDAGEKMSHRFRNSISSLWFTFVHLSGDYPLYRYTVLGRLVNFVMIILAQGLMGIPLGIIVDGFRSEMEEKMKAAQTLLDKQKEAEAKSTGEVEGVEPKSGEDKIAAVPAPQPVQMPSAAALPVGPSTRGPTAPKATSCCFPLRADRATAQEDAPVPQTQSGPSELEKMEEKTATTSAMTALSAANPQTGQTLDRYGRISQDDANAGAEEKDAAAGTKSAAKLQQEVEDTLGTQHQRQVFRALNRSRIFSMIQCIVMAIALVGIMIHSEQDLQGSTLYSTFVGLQWLCCAFFTAAYWLRWYSCPADPKFEGFSSFSGTAWKEWKECPIPATHSWSI